MASPARADALAAIAIAVFAFALRYVYLLQARAVPIFDALLMDAESYGKWSDRIVAGDWLGGEIFYQAPLYPYFLAVAKLAFGSDLWTLRLVQAGLGSLACALLFLAGRVFFSRRAGLVAGAMLAVYPPAIFFDALIQKANLGLVWMCALLVALALFARRPSAPRGLAVGLLLGLMMLTREETILLAPVLLGWSWLATRGSPAAARARPVAAIVAGLALVLLPVAWRNHAVGGEFVLTTSQAGPNFYIGNGPRANGTYVPLVPGRSNVVYERQTAVELAERDSGRKLSPKGVSDFWRDKALAHIRAQPAKWLALLGRKAMLFANAYEMPDAEDQYFYERYVPLLRVLGTVWHYGVLVPLGVAGIVLTWGRRRELLVLHLVLATLAGGVLLFYVFARYRYPVVPLFVLFAAAGVVEAVARLRMRAFASLVTALLALLAAATVANWPLFSKDYQLGESLNNAGIAATQRGELEHAAEFLRAAVEYKPASPEVHGNLALTLDQLGRGSEAIVSYRRALELRPGDPRSEFRLGRALCAYADPREGVLLMRQALARDPTNAEGASWLADGLVRAGEPRAALAVLQEGLKASPASLTLRKRLAWSLATSPEAELRDGARAVELAGEVVARIGAKDLEALDVLAAAQAEQGDFARAVATAERVLALTPEGPRSAAVAARLAQYRAGRAWREPAPPPAR